MNTWQNRLCAIAMLLFTTIGLQATAQVHAAFTANTTHSCSPLVVQFTDQSTGNPTSWKWDFGNGNVSTQRNPGAVYLNPGYKTVKLIVSDGTTSDTLVATNYIQVYNNPTANFGVSMTDGCTPMAVCFTDSSLMGSSPIASWLWDFGDGQSSNLQNPCITYALPGTYSVSLFVTDSNGCSHQIVKPSLIKAVGVPTADFTSGANSSCTAPLVVHFQNNSNPQTSNTTYLWRFGDGTTSGIRTPTHTYANNGSYDVTLRVTVNPVGCTDSIVKHHYVAVEQLVARFSAPTHGCIGVPVSFVDSSTSNPTTWHWDFGDGDTSNLQNPQHAYTAIGRYTVTLAANNTSCGDTVTRTNVITIDASPVANFGATNRAGCTLPFITQFSDSSQNAVAWHWNFGDSITSTLRNPQHTYTQPGVYTVKLTVDNANGCSNTATKVAFIRIIEPKVRFQADVVKGCIPLTVNFTDSSTSVEPIVSWRWSFGDGGTSTLRNPQHTYTVDSVFTVKLIVVNASGCADTLIKTQYIKAGNRPTVAFVGNPRNTCMYTPVNFSDQSTNANEWYWNFGDGASSLVQSPSHTYSDTGSFTIMFVALHNGCGDTLIKPNYVHIAPPHAAFDIVQNCLSPYDVQFTDHSLAPNSWYWSFGDSTTSTQPNPQHSYAHRGTYNVTLTVTDTISGCFDIFAKPMRITDPVANFDAPATTGCRPFVPALHDTSIDASTYNWSTFGLTSTAKNPTFNYTVPGVYDVTLIIKDVNGCYDTIVKPNYITVNGPTANFGATPTTGCAPLMVAFTDSSASFMANIVSWKWLFGDGDSSSVRNPTHLYTVTGSYNVTLTVVDANGCSHTITKNNYIVPTFPKPSFTAPTLSCTSKQVVFTNTSTPANGSYIWNFGDGDTSHQQNPTHIYALEGTYTVTLKVTDPNGCDSTLVKPNYIMVSDPVAGFVADSLFSPCPPLRVNFVDTSIGNPVAWHWDFGDGTTSALQNPSHVYNTPGNFSVRLVITTSLGCTDTVLMNNFVLVKGPNGTFTISPRNLCQGGNVTYEAVTVNTVARTWDFGDGIVANGPDTLVHRYDSTGVYHPVVILDDGLGCLFSISSPDSITVGYLHAGFGVSNTYLCHNGDVTFTDSSITATPIVSYTWDFGDSTPVSHQRNPVHHYAHSGLYSVTLMLANSTCFDTLVKTNLINVDRGPQTDFTMDYASACTPVRIQFTNTTQSDSAVVSVFWNLGNGITDTIDNPSNLYDTAGVYHITLAISSVTGCADTLTRDLTVYPIPVVHTNRDTDICLHQSVQLHATGGIVYQWSPAGSLSANNINNPIATPSMTTAYQVAVTDSNGCKNIDSVKVIVNPLPAITKSPDRQVCKGDTVEIWAAGGTSYSWSPSISLTCSNCADPVAGPDATTLYGVTVTNDFNCSVHDSVKVTVNPVPEGLTQHNVQICYNDSVQLVSTGGTVFNWYPNNNLSCNTCESPYASPDSSTTYMLQIANQYNCGITDTVLVRVNPLPVLSIMAIDSICQGESAQISANGADFYNWSPGISLNDSTIFNPMATPTTTTTYHLIGSSVYGCVSQDSVTIGVNPLPQVHTIDGVTICKADHVKLTTTISGATTYSWSPALGLDDSTALSPNAGPMNNTVYTINVANQYGCTAWDSVHISTIGKVQSTITADTSICIGSSVQLHANVLQSSFRGTQVIWSPLNGLEYASTLDPLATPEQDQVYTLMAYSGTCIPDTQHVTIKVNPLPFLHIDQVEPVVDNTPVKLSNQTSPDVVSYQWSPADQLTCSDCATPVYLAKGTKDFSLTVTDQNGCQTTQTVTVNDVGQCGNEVFVPNYFSPNGDEKNDKLFVRGLGVDGLKSFRIFDRWGNQVFETTDINEGWNGTYKGVAASSGVYVYYVEAICTNGLVYVKQGNVTLMK